MSNSFINFLLLSWITFLPGFGQQKLINYTIQGIVIDSLSGQAIPDVQVFDECARETTVSDFTGHFKISCTKNDTLVFTALGYLGKVWLPSIENKREITKIMMIKRIYDIEPVRISTFPGTYNQFKKAFLDTKPDQGLIIYGLPRPVPKMVPYLLDTNIISTTGFFLNHPISYFYYNFSKEEKSKRKVLYLKQEQKEQVVINQKFNRELVHRLTGLEGENLTEFIGFCLFTHIFLYKATDYKIVEAIHKKYEEYQKLHEKTL